MSEPVIHAGGCRCGDVRLTAEGAPLRTGVCYCEPCRRATGAACAAYVDFPAEAVSFTGEPSVWSPEAGIERLFCGRCGSPLAYRAAPLDPEGHAETAVHLGAFDAPEGFTPDHATHAGEALGWIRRALAPLVEERR